jgi:hypothetical protein
MDLLQTLDYIEHQMQPAKWYMVTNLERMKTIIDARFGWDKGFCLELNKQHTHVRKILN